MIIQKQERHWQTVLEQLTKEFCFLEKHPIVMKALSLLTIGIRGYLMYYDMIKIVKMKISINLNSEDLKDAL